MQLESEGTTPFRMDATFSTTDFMGRPDNQGKWTEEFGHPGSVKRTIKDSKAPETYAPEDQENIGASTPATTGTFMQQLLTTALLMPGPNDLAIQRSRITYKTQKVGTISLRCVILEPQETGKNRYLQQTATRAYCLAPDAPLIRLSQLAFGITVTYNSIAHFGNRTFAQQITATQRGHERGKLQVVKLVAAPELLQADFPKSQPEAPVDTEHAGAKLSSAITVGLLLRKVTPVYPIEAKQKHITGTVVLHAIISKEGTIDSIEVISAPADVLAEAAVEAVSQWTYKPYLLLGKPTEVDTTITVNFAMN